MTQVRDQVWAQVRVQVRDQVRVQVRDQVWAQVRAQVGDQVGAQVLDQVRDQIWDQAGDQVRDQVWAQVWAQVRAQVGAQVWAQGGAQVLDQVRAQVLDQVGDQVWAQVGDQVWAQVRAQVGAQVRDQVGEQVREQVREQVGEQVWKAGYGLHDAPWLAFYDYMQQQLSLSLPRINGLLELARCGGWWWPFRYAVVLTPLPTRLCRDPTGALHAENGPAIAYPDGWGVYAWHGIRVPANVIEAPETLTTAEIVAEQNAEIRRVMLVRFGLERFLREGEAHLVHEEPDVHGPPVRLWHIPQPDDRPLAVVEMVNGTSNPDGSPRIYVQRTKRRYTRALDAVAAMWGMEQDQYIATCGGRRT